MYLHRKNGEVVKKMEVFNCLYKAAGRQPWTMGANL